MRYSQRESIIDPVTVEKMPPPMTGCSKASLDLPGKSTSEKALRHLPASADHDQHGDDFHQALHTFTGPRWRPCPESAMTDLRASAFSTNWLRFMGRARKRTPVAAKMALPRAGAAIEVPNSPMPPGASLLSTRYTSIVGTSFMRRFL